MNEYLCPFDFLQFGPLLAVHTSILLMNADWSGTDLRLITTRDSSWRHLKLKPAEAHRKHLKEDFSSKLIFAYCIYIFLQALLFFI